MSATITKALHEVMGKVAYVQKGQRNKFHNYNYAGEADLLAVLRPAMMEAGLLLIPSAVSQSAIDSYGNTQVVMEYTLAHKDGDTWPHPIRALGCGNDMNSKGGVGDKGTYKAITGANKYLLFKLFQIETGDDPENQTEEPERPALGSGKARDEMDVKKSWIEWANGDDKSDCAKWGRNALLEIASLANEEDLNKWSAIAENMHRMEALHDHDKKKGRYDKISKALNDKRDELRAKMAA
jgi:hypothetical protein